MSRFALRHFKRHWRMNLIVWLVLLLATTFLASLPLYTTAIAGQTLQETLAAAQVPARNIEISRREGSLSAAVWSEMEAELGELVQDRTTIRETGENAVRSGPFFLQPGGTAIPVFEELYYRVWAFDALWTNVRILEGRVPRYIEPDPFNLSYQEQEVAIGHEAAAGMGIALGDELRTAGDSLRLHVVGIVEPLDAGSPIWLDDLTPFGVMVVERGNRPDLVNLSLLVPAQTMNETFPAHREYWRVTVDTGALDMTNIEPMRDALVRLESRWPDVTMETGLITLLDRHLADFAHSQVTVLLLSAQSLIFILYTITMVSSYVLEASRGEISTMVDRGYTGRQITGIFALQGFVLAFLLAAPIGPPLALQVVRSWATQVPIGGLPALSWQLAIAGALFGWLALVLPIYLATRQNTIARQRTLARPEGRTGWQRAYLDFFLLALGALIYWQLADTGSFLRLPGAGSTGDLTDPLLLLGPTLLLIAVAMLFLRLAPLALRLAARPARLVRGFVLPFGLARLARDPAQPSRVILLSSLAAALVFFAVAYDYSLAVRQEQLAGYQSGADIVVGFPHDAEPAQLAQAAELDGVRHASPVYRNDHARWSIELGQQATVLAIEPESFDQVAGYPPAISPLTVPGLMAALTPAGEETVPAIFSAGAHPRNRQIGDQIHYFIGSDPVTFEVRGLILNFPALSGNYIITNLAELEKKVDIDALLAPWDGRREVWLDVAPERQAQAVQAAAGLSGARLRADSQRLLREIQANLPAREALGAFRLNAFILAVLSIAVFLAVHYFGARQRMLEFGILRAEGLSARQLLGLLSLDGALLIGIGLLSGAAIGYGLAWVMRPFFSRALSGAMAGGSLYAILIDARWLVALYLALIAAYLLAMILSSVALLRAGVHRALRLGDE